MVLQYKFEKREKALTAGISVLLGLAIMSSATFVWPGFDTHPAYDNFFVIAVMVMMFPPSMVDLFDRRWRLAVNSRIPDLVRDVSESQKTGTTFVKSLEQSAQANYGPLSAELRKMVAQISWGYPYDEALRNLANSVDTALMYRTSILLAEVGRSGGRLTEILESVKEHIKEIQDLERDRRRQVGPYIMIIYASFGVYLFVVFILFQTFFNQIEALVESGGPIGGGISVDQFFIWFFHMAIIEGTIAGFVAGKMGEGAMTAGLKHVLILLAISIIVFTFFLR